MDEGMTLVNLKETDRTAVGLLAGLATPVWLLTPAGQTVWLNEAARAALGVPADTPPEAFAATFHGQEPAGLRSLHPECHLTVSVSFQGTFQGTDRRGTMTCRLSRVLDLRDRPDGEPLLLAEAAADIAARQEVDRLTEQLIAISVAYPDLRFELRRDGTILDFAVTDPADLFLPPERFLNYRIQDVLPDPLCGQFEAALASVSQGEPMIGFDFSLTGETGSGETGPRYFECRLVALIDGERVMAIFRNITVRREAELALRASEAHNRALIEAVPDVIAVIEADGRIIDVVTQDERLLPCPRDSLAGRFVAELVDADTAGSIMEHLRRTLAGDSPQTVEFWLPAAVGDRHCFQARSVRYGDRAVLSVIRDITGLERSKEALIEREARYRLLLENAADLIVILDPDGTVRYQSPSLVRMLGYQPSEITGFPVAMAVHPDDRSAFTAMVQRLIQEPDRHQTLSFRLCDKIGLCHSFEAVCTNLLDNPLIGGIVVNARDMTERGNAERKAARAHDMLVDAIESLDEGFVLYDAQDRLILCNSKFREIHKPIADLIHPGVTFEAMTRAAAERGRHAEATGRIEPWVAKRLAQHRAAGQPTEIQLSDGRWIRLVEWRTREGGTVGIRTDITDLKRRQAELQAARDTAEYVNQRKSAYVHHLSHELRTPLNAVMGFAQIIADDLLGPDTRTRYREYGRQIGEAGAYMLELINNLLDLAKIEAGRMEIQDEWSDISLLIDMTVAMVQQRAAIAGIAIEVDCGDDLPLIRGDITLIRQMLTNLASNAVKFCAPTGGRVTIAAAPTADGGMVLSVADNGVGMTPEQIPIALDAFGQVHSREINRDKGSGLGLPLTRGLIELHGGKFDLQSAPGVGTTVRLIFPPERVGSVDALASLLGV